MNINDIFNNFSSDQLQQINNFLNSAQGKKLKAGLSPAEKARIIEQFSQIDPKTIQSKLNGLSMEDILKFLK